MKKQIALAALSMILSSVALAGSANVVVRCQSADGLKISGDVPGDEAEFRLTFQQGQKSATIFDELDQQTLETKKNAKLETVEALRHGVWTLSATLEESGKYGFVKMYAIPKTVKYKNITNGWSSQFEANAYYSFSELGNEAKTKRVSCSLKYEI